MCCLPAENFYDLLGTALTKNRTKTRKTELKQLKTNQNSAGVCVKIKTECSLLKRSRLTWLDFDLLEGLLLDFSRLQQGFNETLVVELLLLDDLRVLLLEGHHQRLLDGQLLRRHDGDFDAAHRLQVDQLLRLAHLVQQQRRRRTQRPQVAVVGGNHPEQLLARTLPHHLRQISQFYFTKQQKHSIFAILTIEKSNNY